MLSSEVVEEEWEIGREVGQGYTIKSLWSRPCTIVYQGGWRYALCSRIYWFY
jgi:hypothetical protein